MSNKEKHPRRIKEIINSRKPFEVKEQKYLNKLAEHVRNLEILVERARKSAHGTGERNKQGFRDKGCGCLTCRRKLEKLEDRLLNAQIKLEQERRRVFGKNHSDPDEEFVAGEAQKKLDRIREEND